MTMIKPETAEEKKWFFLGVLHQLATDHAKEFNITCEEADKLIRNEMIKRLEFDNKEMNFNGI